MRVALCCCRCWCCWNAARADAVAGAGGHAAVLARVPRPSAVVAAGPLDGQPFSYRVFHAFVLFCRLWLFLCCLFFIAILSGYGGFYRVLPGFTGSGRPTATDVLFFFCFFLLLRKRKGNAQSCWRWMAISDYRRLSAPSSTSCFLSRCLLRAFDSRPAPVRLLLLLLHLLHLLHLLLNQPQLVRAS